MQRILGFAFLFLFTYSAYAQVDSLSLKRKIRMLFNGSLSASYVDYKNWNGDDHRSVSFISNADYRHRLTTVAGWSHEHQFKAELGYLNYTDSLWIKSADQFKAALQWNEKPGKYLTHSYAFFLQSQFLKSYSYSYSDEGDLLKKRKGWFMAPATMEIAYGLNWRFWEGCRVNTAFATCRIKSFPRKDDDEDPEHLFATKRKVIKSEYGFSTQIYINREFYNEHFIWDHAGRVFFNALDKRSIFLDFSNRFTLKFLKYVQFRIDTHFIYDPDESTKPALRQEFLLGLFYEWKK
jgi:hypothetical protein